MFPYPKIRWVKASELQTQLTLEFKQVFIVFDKPLRKAEKAPESSQKQAEEHIGKKPVNHQGISDTVLKMNLI